MPRFVPMCVAGMMILLTTCSVTPVVRSTPVFSPLPTRAISPLPTPTQIATLPVIRSSAPETARADLAHRLKLVPESVSVERIEPDEFPAGDLGCPQPGQTPRAIPALISGQRILLRVASQIYEYRASGSDVVYCGIR